MLFKRTSNSGSWPMSTFVISILSNLKSVPLNPWNGFLWYFLPIDIFQGSEEIKEVVSKIVGGFLEDCDFGSVGEVGSGFSGNESEAFEIVDDVGYVGFVDGGHGHS